MRRLKKITMIEIHDTTVYFYFFEKPVVSLRFIFSIRFLYRAYIFINMEKIL